MARVLKNGVVQITLAEFAACLMDELTRCMYCNVELPDPIDWPHALCPDCVKTHDLQSPVFILSDNGKIH